MKAKRQTITIQTYQVEQPEPRTVTIQTRRVEAVEQVVRVRVRPVKQRPPFAYVKLRAAPRT